jgi:hypothetical protein
MVAVWRTLAAGGGRELGLVFGLVMRFPVAPVSAVPIGMGGRKGGSKPAVGGSHG